MMLGPGKEGPAAAARPLCPEDEQPGPEAAAGLTVPQWMFGMQGPQQEECAGGN